MKNSFESGPRIDFEKYLNCPSCQESGLYCTKHRTEVEQILNKD